MASLAIDLVKNSKIRPKVKKEFQAIDEGGPTREFFNRVWMQMRDLAIEIPLTTQKIQLFDTQSKIDCIPQTDDDIEFKLAKVPEGEQSEIRDKIRCFYRAIGRIMAHCLVGVEDELIGKLPAIASIALPKLYRSGELYSRYIYISPLLNALS